MCCMENESSENKRCVIMVSDCFFGPYHMHWHLSDDWSDDMSLPVLEGLVSCQWPILWAMLTLWGRIGFHP